MTTNKGNDNDTGVDNVNTHDRDCVITYSSEAARNYIDLIYSYYISHFDGVYYVDMEILSEMEKVREELFEEVDMWKVDNCDDGTPDNIGFTVLNARECEALFRKILSGLEEVEPFFDPDEPGEITGHCIVCRAYHHISDFYYDELKMYRHSDDDDVYGKAYNDHQEFMYELAKHSVNEKGEVVNGGTVLDSKYTIPKTMIKIVGGSDPVFDIHEFDRLVGEIVGDVCGAYFPCLN